MVHAAIGVGSSVGDRAARIEVAARALDATPGVRLLACSRLRWSAPTGGVAAGWFLNGVFRIATELGPDALLDRCREIERRLGRRAARRWADRTVDLDLLLHGTRVIVGRHLTVPHPALLDRAFVLQPLLEVWPDAVDPWSGRPLRTFPAVRPLPVCATLPRPRL